MSSVFEWVAMASLSGLGYPRSQLLKKRRVDSRGPVLCLRPFNQEKNFIGGWDKSASWNCTSCGDVATFYFSTLATYSVTIPVANFSDIPTYGTNVFGIHSVNDFCVIPSHAFTSNSLAKKHQITG